MKKRPIFRKIAVPVAFLMIFEMLILVGGLLSQGLTQKLQKNEIQVVDEKVVSRKTNIESQMLSSWMGLNVTVDRVNKEANRYLETRRTTMDSLLDSSEKTSEFLEIVTPQLLTMLQMTHATGSYVILNTDNLKPSMVSGEYESKPGIYLRNNNPDANNQSGQSNVLMVRSPISVVQKLGIAMNPDWDVNFDFAKEGRPYYDFFYKPFQTAYDSGDLYSWKDMGCWSGPFKLDDSSMSVIAYSVPLILEDGTVYGVLGIDITLDYFRSLLNNYELSGMGTYFLAQYSDRTNAFSHVFGADNSHWLSSKGTDSYVLNSDEYYVHTEDLHLYANNTPFSSEQWVLGAAVPYDSLYTYVRQLEVILTFAVLMALSVGLIGSVYISYHLQQPISNLALELKKQDPSEEIHLQRTGITEIDLLTVELETLSQDVIESGKKFSRILEMASTSIGGFQINEQENTLFVTDSFFDIFGMGGIETKGMALSTFHFYMKSLEDCLVEQQDIDMEGTLFRVSVKGEPRFVQVRISVDEENIYGLAEDVTKALLEKQVITHERDHDSLTDLYNRRAFRRIMMRLFEEQAEELKIGAFLMFDLDNLKYVNDTFGHDAGDHYIRQAADAIEHGIDGLSYCARISGDEFHVFIYGYDSQEAAYEEIKKLQSRLSNMTLMLPDGKVQKLHASGGVAWYPQDSRSSEQLAKYADHAMYVAKKTHKGEISFFDKEKYHSRSMSVRDAAALNHLISNHEIYYVLQPIVDAHTGEIFGYEALMRSTNKELPNIGRILEVAREENKLNKIEELTWIYAIGRYAELREKQEISPGVKLFVNTIPNQEMDEQVMDQYDKIYRKYFANVVMELTEEEKIDGAIWERKRTRQIKYGGKIALDDYGTGYNGEKMLLTIEPDFIKLDISLVRDIDRNKDKQTLMRYMTEFAHNKGMLLIAEGVETKGEMETAIRLGADLLQGFYLGKPEREPQDIKADIKAEVIEASRTL